MSSESESPGQSGNIDTIKELLRKLEEVAVRDPAGEEQKPESSLLNVQPANDAAPKSDALLALTRGTSLKSSGEASAARPIVIDTVPAAAGTPATVKTAYAEERSGKRGIAIAAGSFVLGVAAAGALIMAYQPISQLVRPSSPTSVTGSPVAGPSKPPVSVSAETATAPATAVELTKVEQKSAPAPSTAGAETLPSSSVAAAGEAAAKPKAEETSRTAAAPEPPVISAPAPVQVRAAPQPMPPTTVERVTGTAYRIELPERVDLRAGERRTIDLRLSPAVAETTRLLVVLRHVPGWLSLSKGGAVGKEIWLLPAHQAADVALEAAEGANGNSEIKVQLASIDGRILAERSLSVRATGLPASNAPMVASAPAGNDQMIQRLQARGELLLDTGELEAARTLFRTAAEAGSVTAALRLAETYDPGEIQRFGMMETAADPVMAVRWYEHAQALGSPVATARLATLGRR